jgi:hypothetical protein
MFSLKSGGQFSHVTLDGIFDASFSFSTGTTYVKRTSKSVLYIFFLQKAQHTMFPYYNRINYF